MKRVLLSAVALGAMTAAAAAEPQAMSEGQLAGVAAGAASVVQGIAQWQQADGLALDLGGKGLPICCTLPMVNGGGGASVDIDQDQAATNSAVVTVTRTANEILPGMPDASSEVGFSTRFNFNQSSN